MASAIESLLNYVPRRLAQRCCEADGPPAEDEFDAAVLFADISGFTDLVDRLSRREGLNAGMIREAFATAFPALKPEMVGIDLNERGWLQEVAICYGRDFMPARCSAGQIGARDSAPAKIWRGL